MKKKVTLRELLGEQIVLTILIALYYWMWARRDWQSYYEVIQNCVAVFAILFFAIMADRIRKYKKEAKDELAIAVEAVSGIVMGYLLVGLLVVLAVVRTVAFSVMDLKGV